MNFHLEVLKAEDVQDADGLEVVFPFDLLVDPHYDPGETLRIKRHGNRVSRVHSLQIRTQRDEVTMDTKSGINNKRETFKLLNTTYSVSPYTFHQFSQTTAVENNMFDCLTDGVCEASAECR